MKQKLGITFAFRLLEKFGLLEVQYIPISLGKILLAPSLILLHEYIPLLFLNYNIAPIRSFYLELKSRLNNDCHKGLTFCIKVLNSRLRTTKWPYMRSYLAVTVYACAGNDQDWGSLILIRARRSCVVCTLSSCGHEPLVVHSLHSGWQGVGLPFTVILVKARKLGHVQFNLVQARSRIVVCSLQSCGRGVLLPSIVYPITS